MRDIEIRRLEEKERRYEEILDAAERVFLAKGFEAAKIDDIARKARVSRALVYVYFKDKAEIHLAICLRGLRLLRERFEDASAKQKRGMDKVAAIGRAYIQFSRDFPVYFASITRFEAHRPDAKREKGSEHEIMLAGIAAHEVTVKALLAGQKDGSVRTLEDPMMMAMILWGFMHGVAQLSHTKVQLFELNNVSVDEFLSQSLAISGRALSP